MNYHGEMHSKKGKGFTNPCNHLKSCIAHGSLEELHTTYLKNVEQEQNAISNVFIPIVSITNKDREMLEWAKFIVEESLHVCIIKKRSFRSVKDSEVNIPQERV